MKILKLSIITVNLNDAAGLRKTIDSVATQTFTNYEHLIIDGGSTDGSVDVIKEYEKQYNGIENGLFWVSEPDKGIYDAMNKGILQSNGEYIYFLNTGDILFPDAFSAIFSKQKEKIPFIYGNVKRIPSNMIYDGEFDLKKLFKKNICHQAIFYHRTLFKQLGLFNTQYKTRADYAFNIQVFSKGFKTLYLPVTIANYNDSGISSSYFDINFWADYKENYIQPFKKVIPKRKRYAILWRYFYELLDRNEAFKAFRLFSIITLNEMNPFNTLRGFKFFISKFIR
ncbi:glycosyltransferase family 2 protein [Thermophagus sp. OGC60D27]|uniref:glycosyltransferase family 2 protein n=1 Tax=Thermophagus sp. OGC60D27 TaxID=3458415 RepID=UPI00403815C6